MDNIVMKETWVNATKGYRVGESDWYESFTDEEGVLFRDLQREYGRCTSKVYLELPGKSGEMPIGWVFQKKVKYDDVEEYYIQETWIQMKHRYPIG